MCEVHLKRNSRVVTIVIAHRRIERARTQHTAEEVIHDGLRVRCVVPAALVVVVVRDKIASVKAEGEPRIDGLGKRWNSLQRGEEQGLGRVAVCAFSKQCNIDY